MYIWLPRLTLWKERGIEYKRVEPHTGASDTVHVVKLILLCRGAAKHLTCRVCRLHPQNVSNMEQEAIGCQATLQIALLAQIQCLDISTRVPVEGQTRGVVWTLDLVAV